VEETDGIHHFPRECRHASGDAGEKVKVEPSACDQPVFDDRLNLKTPADGVVGTIVVGLCWPQ
jgi:hypothetical protein